jgi:TolA-binding protein
MKNFSSFLPDPILRCLFLFAIFSVAMPLFSDASFIVLKNNRKVEGEGLRRNAQGQFVIETGSGVQTYDRTQVARAEADRPPAYDQGLQLLKSGKLDQALAVFESIVKKFEGLGWDHRANLMIARTYSRQGKADDALATFKILPAGAFRNPEVRYLYWDVLMETAEYERLTEDLENAVRDTNRQVAGRAQIVRGDMRMKQKQYERAAINYLRTTELFQKEQELGAEALFKAAVALEEMRDERAAGLRKELQSKYPDSEWAGRLQDG